MGEVMEDALEKECQCAENAINSTKVELMLFITKKMKKRKWIKIGTFFNVRHLGIKIPRESIAPFKTKS